MKDYLFVYGTLRKDYNLKLKKQVKDDLHYVGKARIGASMYDLGRYPGAVKDSNGNEIIGDVFLLNDPKKVFRVLDEYEGYLADEVFDSEFIRRRNRVKLESGKNINAWIYWYNFDPENKVKIRYKDYLKYLRNKNIS